MKTLKLTLLFLVLATASAMAQATTCPAPTPGAPHVCLTWGLSTTAGAQYNVYRSTTTGGENYGTPLNATPLVSGTNAYYDASVAIGTQYFYTITAVGTGGVLSAPTAEVSAQIPVPPNPATGPKAAID